MRPQPLTRPPSLRFGGRPRPMGEVKRTRRTASAYSLRALVVGLERPFDLGIGRRLRRHGDELAAAVLDRGALQLVVLTLGVEHDAGAGADIAGDAGLAD